jgi:hypothetical protein
MSSQNNEGNKNAAESHNPLYAERSGSPNLVLHTIEDSVRLPRTPEGPPPPYERRNVTRNHSRQKNQQQITIGICVGLVCTLSVVGIVALPVLYRVYNTRNPYFADTLVMTAIVTIAACLGSALTLFIIGAMGLGLLFARLSQINDNCYESAID